MSAFFFHTPHLCADIGAGEHARFRRLVDELAWRAIERDCDPREDQGPSVLRDALPLPEWVTNVHGPEFGRSIAMHLKTMMRRNTEAVRLPGRERSTSSVLDVHRNTVLAGYSDQVALAVRLALQLPDCMWIEPGDRTWAADLIDLGHATPWPAEIAHDPSAGLPLFDHDGWAHVAELLRADDRDPAVVVYQDGDAFPSQIWAGRPGELREPAYQWWKQATREQRWRASLRGLREHAADLDLPLQLSPDTLHTPAFSPEPDLTWNTVAAAWRPTTPS
jgi:hypothetical protein